MKTKILASAHHSLPFLRWQSMLHLFIRLGAVACLPAFAAENDVFRPYVGYSFSYDENVLGIPDGANPKGEKLSDTSRRAEAGLAFNKRISQQVLSAKLNLAHVTYDRLGALNNDSKDLLANWNWHVGDRLEGNLGASYVEALTPYANGQTPFVNFNIQEPNLRTQRREFVDGAWRLHPSWRLRSGLSRDTLNYDLDSQKTGNRVEDSSELGLDYLARSGSTVGIQLRHTRGDLPNPQQIGALVVDNSYDQNEIKAKINWLLTGKTQLQFLGGHVQRKHDFFSARDYSGLNARLIANWQATGKIGVTLSGWREIGALDDLTASYTLNQGVSIGSTWDLTSKLRLDGQLKHETSDYSGAAAFTSLLPADRKDIFRTASLKLTYRTTDHLQLAALLYRKNRDSNIAGNSTPNNGMMLSSRYEF
ncbi:MAG: putative exosortase B-associated extracellular polysaccharide biosynthesis transporter EpsL [Glaciimonas sp.]|nr:putative exosortase B-associated extracellular polysaccharide biosynthesis transporter EpsL [Glaciimonas sp.]